MKLLWFGEVGIEKLGLFVVDGIICDLFDYVMDFSGLVFDLSVLVDFG